MRHLYRYIDGKFIEVSREREIPPSIYVQDDTLPAPLEHPCDGQYYDSKSAFRATTRAHDCVERGNDKIDFQKKKMPDIMPDLEQAISMVKQGYRPTYEAVPEIDHQIRDINPRERGPRWI